MSNASIPAVAADAPSAVLDGQAVYDSAPLGAMLRYSDGTPRPPERFTRKLRAWNGRNGTGRLVEKSPPSAIGPTTYPAGFTIHHGDFASNGIIVMIVRSIYHVTTEMRFEIIERPLAGMVRVLSRWNGREELKYLAPDMASAQAYADRNRSSTIVLEPVADETLPAHLGRAA